MNSEELRQQLIKTQEQENYDAMVKEYLRIKELVAESNKLTHDEVCNITLLICRSNRVFDMGPARFVG
mgnify:CR=1 FL=1